MREPDRSAQRVPRETREERHEADLAGREAAAVGGRAPAGDPARRPVEEAGGGEAEGFETSEELLVERASHGDQQAAHRILRDRGAGEDDDARTDGEADHERSSEKQPGDDG
jgi:hypothetical protein